MKKKVGFYQIFMVSMILAMAGMLLAMGVIAIQKSLRMNASVDYFPGIDVEIFVKNEDNPDEELIFRNFEDPETSKSIEYNPTYCELSANTLTMNDRFVSDYENNFTLVIKNYSNLTFSVEITSTSIAQIKGEQIIAVEPEITPSVMQIESGRSEDFIVTCDPIVPQKTFLTLTFEDTLKYAVSFNDTSSDAIVSGVPTNPVLGGESATLNLKSNTANSSVFPVVNGDCDYTFNPKTGELILTNISSNISVSTTDLPWVYGTYGSGNEYAGYSYITFKNDLSTQWVIIGCGDNLTNSFFNPSLIQGFGGQEYTYNSQYTLIGPNPNPIDTTSSTSKNSNGKELADNQVLLLRKDILTNMGYDGDSPYNSNWADWTDCDVRIYLNETFYHESSLYEYDRYIETPKLYTAWYEKEDGNGGCTLDETSKIFLLGTRYGKAETDTLPNVSGRTANEAKYPHYHSQNFLVEDYLGTYLSYAKSSNKRLFSLIQSYYWWLRSGYDNRENLGYFVRESGYIDMDSARLGIGVRPCFVLNLA